jgi:hypothetical protein
VIGKPNSGKSTFFASATLADVEIASYPFTTIKPNVGIGYVRGDCPCSSLDERCGRCSNGTRMVPVRMVDVAGLVPGAHKGKGLGNEFLSEAMQLDGLLHIVDLSGRSDEEGREALHHDPLKDVAFIKEELVEWIMGLMQKDWGKILKGQDPIEKISERLSGIRIDEAQVKKAILDLGYDEKRPDSWDLREMASKFLKLSKPILVLANKCDLVDRKVFEEFNSEVKESVPTSAMCELALRRGWASGYLDYSPGDSSFRIIKEITAKQRAGLEYIRSFLERWDTTGVQEAVERMVYGSLGMVAVYPVENENEFTDKDGNVLPDVYLVKRGTTARELAYRVHTELGEKFIRAIDCRSGRAIGADHELSDGDVIKIAAGR